jgi:hypothetical protein
LRNCANVQISEKQFLICNFWSLIFKAWLRAKNPYLARKIKNHKPEHPVPEHSTVQGSPEPYSVLVQDTARFMAMYPTWYIVPSPPHQIWCGGQRWAVLIEDQRLVLF